MFKWLDRVILQINLSHSECEWRRDSYNTQTAHLNRGVHLLIYSPTLCSNGQHFLLRASQSSDNKKRLKHPARMWEAIKTRSRKRKQVSRWREDGFRKREEQEEWKVTLCTVERQPLLDRGAGPACLPQARAQARHGRGCPRRRSSPLPAGQPPAGRLRLQQLLLWRKYLEALWIHQKPRPISIRRVLRCLHI